MELSVRDWVPKDGSDHEFLLSNPEIRMRTKDGNAVRITALQGMLEARRKSAGSLDPQRGQLTGEVLVEFDRRSDKDKAALPEQLRERPGDSDVVRVEADQLEFDLQYARLTVPGRIRVHARDVALQAEDLEVRFNEAEGRVESLRIARGGRLELHDPKDSFATTAPGFESAEDHRATLIDWLQATIQARMASVTPPTGVAAPASGADADAKADADVPVFQTKAEREKRGSPPVRYWARFDGDVDARHFVAEATRSRLQADALEILRDFSDSDKAKVRSAGPGDGASGGDSTTPPAVNERIVLEWSGRLAVEALASDDPRLEETIRSRVTAIGAPAKLQHSQGQADCSELIYEPDDARVRLRGSDDAPVVVRSDQGTMSGAAASLERRGDALAIEILGPGELVASVEGPQGAPPTGLAPSTIAFEERLSARGRFVTRTTVDFTGTVSSREHRVLESALFAGRVKIVDDQTELEADTLDVTFAGRAAGGRSLIERVVGSGDVVMRQDEDQITCRVIDVTFAEDATGRSVPTSANATGNVLARQGERILSARDSLIVDFEAATAQENASRTRSVVRRLRALGDATVHDPVQALDVSSAELDCTVINGREIESALVIGADDRPATARLDVLTVTGARILLHVPDQWAEVPGAGRLTFLSKKDLNGEKLSQPLPVAVTWSQSMRFRGRENRAVVNGDVHAASESTTFDCDQLLIEFQDVAAKEPARDGRIAWGILQPFMERAMGKPDGSGMRLAGEGFAKEPVYILADGHAVAEMAEMNEESAALSSRSRISGPRLSVNLRSDESKMLVEGAGNLQLEDFRPPPSGLSAGREQRGSDLFGVDKETGPSKTLIEWRQRMWYDFIVAQARFEGDVQLKHFSGAELEKLFEMSTASTLPPGRSTFLRCDALSVDFTDRDARAKDVTGRRRGRLSADHLRQFHAAGSVLLQDHVEGLRVTADAVVFERPRQILAINGTKYRKATIVTQKPGKLPNQVATERLFYNLATGKVEMSQTTVKGQ